MRVTAKGRFRSGMMCLVLILSFGLFLQSVSQVKKLEVIVDKADVHLNPDESSPVVETLDRGAILSLASALKSRLNWYYVYFTSAESGTTRSGYIQDSLVQKLYPAINSVTISSGSDKPLEHNNDRRYFRERRWGISQEKFTDVEGNPDRLDKIEGLDVLTYQKKIMGMNCAAEFIFADNKLVRERFSFVPEHSDKNRYIADYQRLRNLLIQTHGEPRGDKVTWVDASLRRDSSAWGEALALGQVEFRAQWKMADTEIELSLYRDNTNNRIFLESECRGLQARKPSKGALL